MERICLIKEYWSACYCSNYDGSVNYFRYWLFRRFLDDEKQINKSKGIVSRFKDKLSKMIEDVNGRIDDYSFS